MSDAAIDLDSHTPEECYKTEDGLQIRLYKINGCSYVDLDWEDGSEWDALAVVEPEQILSILLKGLKAEEGEIAEITSGIKVLSAEEFEELGGEEYMHSLGDVTWAMDDWEVDCEA